MPLFVDTTDDVCDEDDNVAWAVVFGHSDFGFLSPASAVFVRLVILAESFVFSSSSSEYDDGSSPGLSKRPTTVYFSKII